MTSKQRNKWKDVRRILIILALLLLPVTLWAQRGRVSLNLQNEEVSLFIQQVEKQTHYTFGESSLASVRSFRNSVFF